MKRILSLVALATSAMMLMNCASEPVHVHHYHPTTKRTTKSASVSSHSNTPEGFQAVSPPSSYSQ
jgi:PBP1b-binding outer membrane lipoprotein LpoB